ncbi:MAG: hypothetical protein JWQ96_1011 [Segetibacter sp.]|nr:hypothetical protein [Segetibacter sp.]
MPANNHLFIERPLTIRELMKNPIRQILLAEDNLHEYNVFIKAVYSLSAAIKVIRVDDGYSLLTMLQTSINPDVIFLDVNMKYKNGLLTLSEIREHNNLTASPIILLSQSDYANNIALAYKLGATYFIRKTGNPEKLAKALQTVFSSPFFSSGAQPPWESFYIS